MLLQYSDIENDFLRRLALVLMAITLTPIFLAGGIVIGIVAFIGTLVDVISEPFNICRQFWNKS